MIIAGHDTDMAAWAGRQLGVTFQEPYTAFGFTDDEGFMQASSVLNDYYPDGNIEWSHVGPLRLYMIRFLVKFVFLELMASRVTAKTRRANLTVRAMLNRKAAGFQFEGVQRQYFGPTKDDDAMVFVMYRANAKRWLKGSMQ